MEDHTKGAAFLLKWHIQGWWVGPQQIDDTYSNNVSITVACWVDFNTWRWFACVQASHFRFRAARENAQTSHARERRSELQERARKQAARENRRASCTKERASERKSAHKRATRRNAQAYPPNKRLARRLPCGLKIINLHLLVNSFPSDRAVLCCCFRINTRLVCVFVWFIYRKRAIIMPHAAGVQDLTESLNRFCLIRFVCVLLGNIYNL